MGKRNKICLGIDARMYGPKHTGIGRYVENLVSYIVSKARKNPEIKITLFARAADIPILKKKYGGSCSIVKADFPHYSLKEQLIFPFILYRARCHLIHFPHFNVPLFYFRPLAITVHDLTKHKFKSKDTTTHSPLFFFIKHWAYRLTIFWAVKRARLIITPSQYVKKEIIRYFHKDPQVIKVAYEGVDKKIKNNLRFGDKERKKVLRKYRISKPYFLYVGNVYPHKNVLQLIEAVKKLHQEFPQIELVIVCARNVFQERIVKQIEKLKAANFVRLTGFVPDKDLLVLYREALAFVFPSFSEGFGLPGLEAMASSTPVVASNASCLPEIYGSAALYFNPRQTSSLVKALKKIITSSNLRKKLINNGRQQVRKYSWEKMGKEIFKGYLAVLNRTSKVS